MFLVVHKYVNKAFEYRNVNFSLYVCSSSTQFIRVSVKTKACLKPIPNFTQGLYLINT